MRFVLVCAHSHVIVQVLAQRGVVTGGRSGAGSLC